MACKYKQNEVQTEWSEFKIDSISFYNRGASVQIFIQKVGNVIQHAILDEWKKWYFEDFGLWNKCSGQSSNYGSVNESFFFLKNFFIGFLALI